MLEVRNLNVAHGDIQVLYDISINVGKKEIVAIVGANASGKTTLLSAINRLIPKLSGDILFEGQSITRLKAHEIIGLGIVQVPEGRQLFPFLKVSENLEMGAYCKRVRHNLRKNMERVYQLLPVLYDRRNQLASSLSGGEAQMCAIGRSLMAEPILLMLDEPSLGLAPKMVAAMFDIVKEINESGTTVILVEQNVKQSLRIALRAYVLENGRIVIEGSGKDLLEDGRVKKAYLGL